MISLIRIPITTHYTGMSFTGFVAVAHVDLLKYFFDLTAPQYQPQPSSFDCKYFNWGAVLAENFNQSWTQSHPIKTEHRRLNQEPCLPSLSDPVENHDIYEALGLRINKNDTKPPRIRRFKEKNNSSPPPPKKKAIPHFQSPTNLNRKKY